jgi:phage regulator Rha-like protein
MNAIKKTDLVHVNHGKPFTDTLVIAEKCELPHASVIKLVRKYKSDFEELGRVRFQIDTFRTKGGVQQREYSELNEDQATYLITLFRNNDIVRAFKLSLVKEFRKVINELDRIKSEPDRKQAVSDKRETARFMTDSLIFARDLLGKKTSVNHFTNEHLFCNRAFNGEWKPLDETTLDTYDLRLLKAIRERNAILIQHYPKQADRKQMVDDFVQSYLTKHPRLQLVL